MDASRGQNGTRGKWVRIKRKDFYSKEQNPLCAHAHTILSLAVDLSASRFCSLAHGSATTARSISILDPLRLESSGARKVRRASGAKKFVTVSPRV